MKIPFNTPFTLNQSIENLRDLIDNPDGVANKNYSVACANIFKSIYPEKEVLMINSYTSALEVTRSIHKKLKYVFICLEKAYLSISQTTNYQPFC